MTLCLSRWSRGAATFATLLLLTGCGRDTLPQPLPHQPLPQPTTPKGLQTLDLNNVHNVTDARLEELAGMKGLQVLNLSGTQVTDAGLKELAALKGLQELHLFGTQVTDAGLKELAGLKALQVLSAHASLLARVSDLG